MTDAEIEQAFNVDPAQLSRWQRRHPKFRESLARWKEIADGAVVSALFKRAVGYDYDAEKPMLTRDGELVTARYKQHIPPEDSAASLWLRNRQPCRWRDKVDHEHSGTIEHQLSLMKPEERLAKAEELLRDAVRYLPLLEQVEAELGSGQQHQAD